MLASPALANDALGSLVIVEEMLYGEAQTGSLLERIEKIELDIYGKVQEGAVLMRIDRVLSFLQDSEGDGGLQLLLNLAEWGFSATLSGEKPMVERLDNLELVLYGVQQSGTIQQRAEKLMLDVWGTTSLDVQQVVLPAQTLVKVALDSTVSSAGAQVGDTVLYQVVEDVMIGGRVVIPVGTRGVATVTEVTAAARLGRMVGWYWILAGFPHLMGPKFPSWWMKRPLNAAAPWVCQGRACRDYPSWTGWACQRLLCRGKDVQIEAGTQFYVETADHTSSGILFQASSQLASLGL